MEILKCTNHSQAYNESHPCRLCQYDDTLNFFIKAKVKEYDDLCNKIKYLNFNSKEYKHFTQKKYRMRDRYRLNSIRLLTY